MKCQEVELLLSEYLDEVLEPEWQELLYAHCQSCSKCQHDLMEMQRMRQIMHTDLQVVACDVDRAWKQARQCLKDEGVIQQRVWLRQVRVFAPYSIAATILFAVILYQGGIVIFSVDQPVVQQASRQKAYWQEHTFFHNQLAAPVQAPDLGLVQASYSHE